MKYILLTGATGYIASHTWIELLANGYNVIGVDNFSNSQPEVLKRIEFISGKTINFIYGDICELNVLEKIFMTYNIEAIMHFAAYKAVGESVANPLKYYQNNVNSLMNLLAYCIKYKVNNFVFSSSATVYGSPNILPIKETCALHVTNPYGQTKLISENILNDIKIAYPQFNIAILRYFNPVGAHKSGLIGEVPRGVPNNIMPYISQVAQGIFPCVNIFGNDYATIDGTGVRDYIHILDLVDGHLKALDYILHKNTITVNLGTGNGYSVLQLINTFAKVNHVDIPYKILPRRDGDIASCYADVSLAYNLMQWQAKYSLIDMCKDTWFWNKKNKCGYQECLTN